MISEKVIDMNELINSFDECSTDYTKTACTYYGDYLRNYQKEKIQLQNNWNELKKWLEEEKDRLVRECSQIYEDSLGKTRLVNEDIYNEVKNISDKMQEIENRKV